MIHLPEKVLVTSAWPYINVTPHLGNLVGSVLSADITDALNAKGENELVVHAEDDVRTNFQPSGKQSHQYNSYGCMYTRTTGIFMTRANLEQVLKDDQ